MVVIGQASLALSGTCIASWAGPSCVGDGRACIPHTCWPLSKGWGCVGDCRAGDRA